jgi:two-component system, chemotaxis family, chemotaxis protein CheY
MLRDGSGSGVEDRRLCAGMVGIVVEDDPSVMHVTVRALEELGMEVVSCWDAESALKWFANNDAPDVAVLGFLLPEMSGLSLARDMRRSYHLANAKILILTAQASIGDAIAAARISAMLFPKPFRHQQLKDAVIRLLRDGKPLPKILIVDDDDCVREALASVVADEGFDPLCARDGAEALRMLKAHAPDLILLDIMMPGVDGLSVAREVQTAATTLTPPIVFVSALEEVRAESERMGAFGHLRKPVEVDDIVEIIRRATNTVRTD